MDFADQAREVIQHKKAGLYALLLDWAGNLEDYAKSHASWVDRTSHARQGIHAGVDEHEKELVLFLSHGMKYGTWLETGTEPHVIRPKEAKALYWRGAEHPVKVVHHPGSKAHPIIKPTVDLHIDRIRNSIRDYWRD